jgi:predicted ester cyclase
MTLSVVEHDDLRVVEGAPEQRFLSRAEDASRIVEACLSNRTRCALLYAHNLTDAFFDLSSGEAGLILQKLRSYRVRLAVVCPPGSVQFSSRFGELLAAERRGLLFDVFETRSAARQWLGDTPAESRPVPAAMDVVRRWIAFANAGFAGDFGELIAADYVGHLGAVQMDRAELERLERDFVSAFPDAAYVVEELLADGDRVVLRATTRGTQRGEFEGIAPTNRRVEFTAIVIYRIHDGLIAESWGEVDLLRLMRQLRGMENA